MLLPKHWISDCCCECFQHLLVHCCWLLQLSWFIISTRAKALTVDEYGSIITFVVLCSVVLKLLTVWIPLTSPWNCVANRAGHYLYSGWSSIYPKSCLLHSKCLSYTSKLHSVIFTRNSIYAIARIMLRQFCLSVRLSVRHMCALYSNGWTYRQNSFTVWWAHHSSFSSPRLLA